MIRSYPDYVRTSCAVWSIQVVIIQAVAVSKALKYSIKAKEMLVGLFSNDFSKSTYDCLDTHMSISKHKERET